VIPRIRIERNDVIELESPVVQVLLKPTFVFLSFLLVVGDFLEIPAAAYRIHSVLVCEHARFSD
jgi:hypothetical protein